MPKVVDLQNGFYLDEWRVEPQIGRVSREFRSVSLEPKVMEVLVLLARNYPNVVRKEVFLETVWADVNVVGHVLTRAVSEIRRVLNDDPRNPHVIQTIPRIGYRLLVPITTVKEISNAEGVDEAEKRRILSGTNVAIGAAACGILIFVGFFALIILRGGMHPH